MSRIRWPIKAHHATHFGHVFGGKMAQQKTLGFRRKCGKSEGLNEWAEPGSNRRHMDFQSIALPAELSARAGVHSRRAGRFFKNALSVTLAARSDAIAVAR